MSDRTSAVSFRILGPRRVLLGTGDGDSLENINTTSLPNGSSCWVVASRAEFRLYKDDNTTPPDGTNVIEPASGPGRWFIQVNTGSGIQVENVLGLVLPQRPLLQTEGLHPVNTGTAIRLVNGEVDPLAWPSLSAAVAANPGRTLVLINGAHTADADLTDPTVTLKFRQGATLAVPVSRTIATRIDMSQGGIIVPAAGVTVTQTGPILAPATAQLWDTTAAGSDVLLAANVLVSLTPEMFGASLAAADNSVAFNKTIAVAAASGIGLVQCASGRYLFTSLLALFSGTQLSGTGSSSKFFTVNTTNDRGTILDFTGMAFSGPDDAAIHIVGTAGNTHQIEKVLIEKLDVLGPGKSTVNATAFRVWNCRNITFSDLYINGWDNGHVLGRDSSANICAMLSFYNVFWNSCLTTVDGERSGLLVFADFINCVVRNGGLAGAGGGYVGTFCARWIGGFCGGNACTTFDLKGSQNCMISTDIENSGVPGGGFYDIRIRADSLGNASQGIAIIGTGTDVSGAAFGRTASIFMEDCDGYFISGCQIASAPASADSLTLVGILVDAASKGFVGPCHYEGFTGARVKLSVPSSNNFAFDESANAVTRLRRLGTVVTDEITEALLSVGDTIPRYKLQVDGKMLWGDGSSSADTTFRRKAAGLQELLGALELIGTAYLRFPSIAAGAALDRSVYVDTADKILKFIDDDSNVRVLSRQFAMPDLGGMVLDLDGDVGVTGSAGTFAWSDQSGNGTAGVAFAGSNGLTSAPDAAFNNHTVVLFNGVDDGVTADAAAGEFSGSAKPAYLVTVAQLVTTPTPGSVWCFGSNASLRPLFILKSNGVINWQIQRRNDANTIVTATGGVPSTTTAHLFEVTWDGTNITMWIDGVQVIAPTALATDPVTFNLFTLGLLRVMGSTIQFGNFKLARHLMFKRIPSAIEQTAMQQFMQYMYGTPAL